ncbi:hypothetical protein D9M71_775520 [compost metagenome]
MQEFSDEPLHTVCVALSVLICVVVPSGFGVLVISVAMTMPLEVGFLPTQTDSPLTVPL